MGRSATKCLNRVIHQSVQVQPGRSEAVRCLEACQGESSRGSDGMNSLRLLAIMLMFVSTSERWAFLLLGQKLQGHPATLCHRFVRFARRFLPTSVTEVFARSVIAIELLEDTNCPRSFASGSVYLKAQALPPISDAIAPSQKYGALLPREINQ